MELQTMNNHRYRIVAVGDKSPSMMSEITKDLFKYGCEIHTISSLRLGHSFVIVLMIETFINEQTIEDALQPVMEKYNIQLNIDHCKRGDYKFVKSDAFIRIKGDHAPGIMTSIIGQFSEAGLDIHGLESDVYNKDGHDVFVSNIKGQAKKSIENLANVANTLKQQNINVTVATDWQLLV